MIARATAVCSLLLLTLGVAACGSTSATAPSAATSNTVTWTTFVGPGGTASRSFTTTVTGAVSVTLQASSVPLGVGIGIPRVAGGGCRLAVSTIADPGSTPHLTTPVDVGDYCVAVFDTGGITDQIPFTLQVVLP